MSGLLLALQAHFIRPEYFTEQFSLFPTWPVMDSARALQLFYITMGILFSPKIFGLLLLMFDGEMCRTLGGTTESHTQRGDRDPTVCTGRSHHDAHPLWRGCVDFVWT